MSYADFNRLAIRNTTCHNTDGFHIPTGKVFTVGERGKLVWSSDLGLNNLLVSTVSAASTINAYTSYTNVLSVHSTGYIPSFQVNSIVATSTIGCSTISMKSITTSTISADFANGEVSQFISTSITNSNVTGILYVTGNTAAGSANISGDLNISDITYFSTIYCTSFAASGNIITSTLFVNSVISTGSLVVQTDAIFRSTLDVSSIGVSYLRGNNVNISDSLYVGSTLSVSYAQYSTLNTSTITALNANSLTLNVYSTISVPKATITSLSTTYLSTQNISVLSTLTVGSTTTSYILYSTMIGSTLSVTFGSVISSLTVGLSINAPLAQLSSINNSTFFTNVVSIRSSVAVGSILSTSFIQLSTLVGSAITTTTATVLSTVAIGSNLTVPTILISTLVCSTLTTTIGLVVSTLSVGSTIVTPSIQLSTLVGNLITTTATNVLSLLTTSSINTSSLIGSTIFSMNGAITSTLTVGSTIIAAVLSTQAVTLSSVTINLLSATSSATLSTISTTVNTTTIIACSTLVNFQGKQVIGADSAGASGFMCSNLPISLDGMTAVIERSTNKVVLSNVANISTLYKVEYHVYNGSSWIQGVEVPPSTTPISLSTLKFPVGAYNLSTVGSWCSFAIDDMTNFTGTWVVTALCVRSGTYGDDLYSLELTHPVNTAFVTTVPDPPTNVVTSQSSNGIIFTFTPPIVTGGYISGYEAFATSDGGVTYYTKIGSTSPITVTGLTTGVTYTLSIKAKNAKGQSVAAPGSPATILYTGP